MITPERIVSAATGRVSFKVRFRYRGKQTSETFARLNEAKQFSQWVDALGPQGALDKVYESEQQNIVPTLTALAAAHIEHLTGIEDGTRLTYTRLWDRTFGPLLGHIPANRVTKDDVAKAVINLSSRYSHKSLQNQRGLLAAVLARAVDLGYLTKNPAKGIRLPRGDEGEAVEMRVLTHDEFAQLLEAVPEHYRPLVRFLGGTGCRWGEAVALEVRDLALPNVRIRRALKWSPDNHRRVGATKTRKSNRTVQLPTECIEDLRELAHDRARNDLVFTAPKGGPVRHRTFWSRVWLPAVRDLDPPRPRIHDLRHTHVSWLLDAGVPIPIVQARLGHESIKTTVDTYGHLLPDAQLGAAQAASLAFSGAKALGT